MSILALDVPPSKLQVMRVWHTNTEDPCHWGQKGQNTQWIHGEHIENTDNMCLQCTQQLQNWVYFEQSPKFVHNVPSRYDGRYILNVPSALIKLYPCQDM